jgi:murein L,D-transpeptidase YcbB/YkuD
VTISVRRVPPRGVWLLVVAIILTGCHRKDRAVGEEIRAAVSSPSRPAKLERTRWKVVRQLYQDRKFRPIWTSDGKPKEDIRQLVATLCGSEQDGLRPADYHLAALKHVVEQAFPPIEEPTPAALATLDLQLTARFVNYGADLLVGRLAPAAVDSGWFIKARHSSADSLIRVAASGRGFTGMMAILRPKRADYDELVAALASYRKIQQNGGWPAIPTGALVRGAHGAAIAALRRRLEISGDLLTSESAQPVYDGAVAAAIARFQRRHGIAVDSTVGGPTLAALDTPVDYWIRQIEINLERYRWLPPDFGNRYILVNIPDYHLYAFGDRKPVLDMRVIVGDEYGNATPVFADSMSYIVFRPQWYLPRRIVVDEVIPQAEQNVSYIAEHNFEVVSARQPSKVLDPDTIDWEKVDTAHLGFRVRQKSGADNPLGRVKFMFPNQFSVYLHDTPAGWLFDQPRRTLSHGCVRVERPAELADFVLAGQDEWTDSTVRAAMTPPDTIARLAGTTDAAPDEQLTVQLKQKVPVYILYLTAYVQDGVLNFRGDPYGKDAQALSRLSPSRPGEQRLCEEVLHALPIDAHTSIFDR